MNSDKILTRYEEEMLNHVKYFMGTGMNLNLEMIITRYMKKSNICKIGVFEDNT